MKHMFMLAFFWLLVSALPSFAADTGECLTIDIGEGINLEMVNIPAGKFQMGCPPAEPIRNFGESPVHTVIISNYYYIGKHEVTQGQWTKITGSNPSCNKSGDSYPVECVSSNDITTRFLPAMNAKYPGHGTFRLPTEAEWERACRAGQTTRFYWGDTFLDAYAWNDENSDGKTHQVGQKLPNAFDLFDMSGNVQELCSDWYEREAYPDNAVTDPTGPVAGTIHAVRGGWYGVEADACRSGQPRCRKP